MNGLRESREPFMSHGDDFKHVQTFFDSPSSEEQSLWRFPLNVRGLVTVTDRWSGNEVVWLPRWGLKRWRSFCLFPGMLTSAILTPLRLPCSEGAWDEVPLQPAVTTRFVEWGPHQKVPAPSQWALPAEPPEIVEHRLATPPVPCPNSQPRIHEVRKWLF